MKKVLITGKNGTIANILIRDLSVSYDVVGISRSECELTDYNQLLNVVSYINPDIIIHTAFKGANAPISMFCFDDIVENLKISQNINLLSKKYKIINIASGIEYGSNIDQVKESEIHNHPLYNNSSYSISKRLTYELFSTSYNIKNIRIFGCFDNLEPNFRLLKKISNYNCIPTLYNKEFSWISGKTLSTTVNLFIQEFHTIPSVVNVAYKETENLSLLKFVQKFAKIHDIDLKIDQIIENSNNYTCNTELFYNLNIKIPTLEQSLKNYHE